MKGHVMSNTSTNNLQLFSYEDKEIRTVIIDGDPWWIAKDVCELLGYKNDSDALQRHSKGVVKRYPLQTAGGMQELRILSEPDLLRLIVGSTLPEAVKFEKWVFEVVLPQIRKTGGYEISPEFVKPTLIEGKFYFDSRDIASWTAMKHSAVLDFIDQCGFTTSIRTNQYGIKHALLDMDQTYALTTKFDNTERNITFKAEVVKASQDIQQLHESVIRAKSYEQQLSQVNLVLPVLLEGQNKMFAAFTAIAEKILQPATVNPNAPGPQKPIKPTKASGEELLTAEEVADILKVSVNTLRNWRYLGTGPVTTPIGKQVRYKRSAVQDYIDSNVKKSEVDMGRRTSLMSYLTNAMSFSTLPRVLYEDISLWQVSTMTSQRMEAFKELFEYDEGKIVFEDDIINRGLKLLYESITKE
jgi:prophage antirepressor-like protein/predicted DNA-binding transcriptional regulator AlpA